MSPSVMWALGLILLLGLLGGACADDEPSGPSVTGSVQGEVDVASAPDPEDTGSHVDDTPATEPSTTTTQAPADTVTVHVRATPERTVTVTAELADTSPERFRGLQERAQLDPDAGMVFVFPAPADHTFWMKDTPITLDMIFIGADLTVAGVVHEAQPFTTEVRRVQTPSLYVLEVNGGWATANGVDAGDAVMFEPETPVAADAR